MKTTGAFIGLAMLCAICLSAQLIFSPAHSATRRLSSFDSQVQDLMSKMTLEEKVGQMTQPELSGIKDVQDVEKYYLGSVLSGGGSDPKAGNGLQAWTDTYEEQDDIYGQHVLASGIVDPAWPVNGLAICVAPDAQGNVVMISDGLGGAIVSWVDCRRAPWPSWCSGYVDLYAQRVLGSGQVARQLTQCDHHHGDAQEEERQRQAS